MRVEVVPHLVGASFRPTGQRGLFSYWRVGASVLVPNALRYLRGQVMPVAATNLPRPTLDGVEHFIREGDDLPANDPVAKACPDLFRQNIAEPVEAKPKAKARAPAKRAQ